MQAAKSEGKWVGVCGGIAGEPIGAAILTGLGVSELSVSIPSVAAVKAKLRSLSLAQAEDLANRAEKAHESEGDSDKVSKDFWKGKLIAMAVPCSCFSETIVNTFYRTWRRRQTAVVTRA